MTFVPRRPLAEYLAHTGASVNTGYEYHDCDAKCLLVPILSLTLYFLPMTPPFPSHLLSLIIMVITIVIITITNC